VLLVLLAFVVGQGDFGHFSGVAGTVQPASFGLALVSVLWAYDGGATSRSWAAKCGTPSAICRGRSCWER